MASSNLTTNHETIRKWAEARGGTPASVKGSHEVDMLGIDFSHDQADSLAEISWDEFFAKFDENHLAFMYQDQTRKGGTSRFFKFIDREDSEDTPLEVAGPVNQVSDDVIDNLKALMWVDIDAFMAYDLAIDRLKDANFRRELEKGREDHERHIMDLEIMILGLGEEPPTVPVYFERFHYHEMMETPPSANDEGTLEAMENNEQLINAIYEDALQIGGGDEIKALIRRNREDELQHLQAIERCLHKLELLPKKE